MAALDTIVKLLPDRKDKDRSWSYVSGELHPEENNLAGNSRELLQLVTSYEDYGEWIAKWSAFVQETNMFRARRWFAVVGLALAAKLRSTHRRKAEEEKSVQAAQKLEAERKFEEAVQTLANAYSLSVEGPEWNEWGQTWLRSVEAWLLRWENFPERYEVLDLCCYLSGEPLPSQRSITLAAVGDDVEAGFVPYLTLEWVEARKTGFSRHPLTFLLETNEAFEVGFKNVQELLTGIFGNNAWESGMIRWRLSGAQIKGANGGITNRVLLKATGESMSALIGVGAILLNQKEECDQSISITATIDKEGHLKPVEGRGIGNKMEAFRKQRGSTLLLCGNQDIATHLEQDEITIERPSTLFEAAEQFAQTGKFRRAYLAGLRARMENVTVLGLDTAELSDLYIETPVLEEVKVEIKPEREGRKEGEQEERSAPLRPQRGYEEFLSGERQTTVRKNHSLRDWINALPAEYRKRKKPFFLYGPPGSGKTTLLRYIASHLANQKSIGTLVPVFLRLSDWFSEPREPESLPEYLTAVNSEGQKQARSWTGWLKRGEVLLMLDGLDEVTEEQVKQVKALIELYPDCPAIVTCRTITSLPRFAVLAPEVDRVNSLSIFTPAELTVEQQTEYIKKYASIFNEERENGRPFNVDAIKEYIAPQKKTRIQELAANPQLLTLICFLAGSHFADEKNLSKMPATRLGLYEAVVNRLLEQMAQLCEKEESNLGIKEWKTLWHDPKLSRPFFETLARLLFLKRGKDSLVTSRADVVALFDTMSEDLRLPRLLRNRLAAPAADPSALLELLCRNSFLIVREGDGCSFLHLTLLEYLAACGVARLIQPFKQDYEENFNFGERCNAQIANLNDLKFWEDALSKIDEWYRDPKTKFYPYPAQFLETPEQFIEIVDHQCWSGAWFEVFVFLACVLAKNEKTEGLLIQFLVWEARDDMFRHRLSLAILCGVEALEVAHARKEE